MAFNQILNPMPVSQNIVTDANNSSTSNLGIGNNYAGTSTSTLNYILIQVNIFCNESGTLFIDQSQDGTNWDITDSFIVAANTGYATDVVAVSNFYRVRFVRTSTAAATTTFRIESFLVSIGNTLPRTLTQAGNFKVSIQEQASKATYRASTSAVLVAAVTATTPFFSIYGSATKTIRITKITISGLTLTAVAYLNIGLRKYSTATTGGTSSSVPFARMDSANAVSGATVLAYTAAPTAGTNAADVASRRVLGQATTAAATGIPQIVEFVFSEKDTHAPVLRGTTEGLGLIWLTAPATAVSMLIDIEGTEE